MVVNNEDPKMTAFTITVDAKLGTTTGISAGDRATTLRALADSEVHVAAQPVLRPRLYFVRLPQHSVPWSALLLSVLLVLTAHLWSVAIAGEGDHFGRTASRII